ncbi:hydro-lyase, Fe-S type, tartrate/fumarate subfamily, alpha subunit [Caldithrix abyssi DSM 13497]|uniref:Fumarate hydratase, class I n=1 Tax=Caldithrix abyssi DSM 13497 TaxID=880073 RepID=H1XTY8_CALAY|nr:fumarate hydratase [Caldithrix abyssi]APF16924.1 fumarate hydratase, class I [Caldithrix abyssi DSM 13497]EHO40431.1 hydro-lyase, Fe-S type, tartrate/fumarate subfamily, alpha subunit [Caldithrix abyssi DSM 13497]
MELKEAFLELIRRAATDLPPDVEAVLQKAYEKEDDNTPAKNVFATILENVKLARKQSTPICQDTGSLVFYIDYPEGGQERTYREAIEWAAVEATNRQYLRPNAVDPISGKNSGNNLGINAPYIHFHQWQKDEVRVRLLLKGGGSENVGAQYKLPHPPLNAGRDLKGVRKVIIDAVKNAQGLGCAPGSIGVGIGGGRDTSYALSKEQFFRKMGERSPNPELAELETRLLEELNQLQIGPMGFGGKTTVLEVFIASQARHPATYYVSVSYNCWAYRRKTMTIKNGEVRYDD